MYEVVVLKPGYATWVGPTQQHADGTITLVKGPKLIIVDTGGPWNKRFLQAALRKHGVRADAVDFLVCTHGHSDHTGNNNLFPNATVILSYDVCQGDLYTFHDFQHGQPYTIDDDVRVIPTPGHTHQDITVMARTPDGVVAITGDLFESADDLTDDNLWRSFSEFPDLQARSREHVLSQADFIVPGHGPMFRVKDRRVVHSATPSTPDRKLLWYILVPLLITIVGGILLMLVTGQYHW